MSTALSSVASGACERCGAVVLKSAYDVLLDVPMPVIVDPSPLPTALEVACVIADRPVFLLERTGVGYALGLKTWATAERHMNLPRLVLPAHQCGFRFPGDLPEREDFELNMTERLDAVYGEEKPAWMP